MRRSTALRGNRPLAAVLALAGAVGLVCAAQPSRADDYAQWRGPKRDGISQEEGLLAEWPKEGPKLVWQVNDIGFGFSTPAVVGTRIYLLSSEGLDKEFVQALDARNGKRVWATTLGKVGNPNQMPNHPGSRSTPTVDGAAVYALSSDGDLACLDAASGAPRWKKSLRTDFGGQPGTWAYAESPLVDGDALVVTPGGADATLVKLNKRNGEVIWKCPVPGGEPAAYGSAVVTNAGGLKQYVQILQKGMVGVDAATGKLLWRYDKCGGSVYIPTPVVEGSAAYTSGRPGGGMVRIKADQGTVTAEQVYAAPKLPNAIGGSVKVGDCLYGATNQSLLCADFATGTLKWEDRCLGAASVCCADGNLYVHGENGDVALVKATPEGYQEKGRFSPPGQPDRKQDRAWAYPVVANGRLYIRDLGTLWCYDIKAK